MSLIITKAELNQLINEELRQVLDELNPHKTLADQEPEDFEEPEEVPDALRADTVLGLAPQDVAAEPPAPQRPPKKYRRLAIQMLVGLMDVDHIRPQDIDVVAWQLYNNAMEGPTRAMDEPPKKPALLKRISARLKQIVAEELEIYLAEVHSEEQRTYMCVQASLPDSERKKGLSKAQAEEMCHGPMKES